MTTYHTFFLFKQSHILRRTAISGVFQVLRSESVMKAESGHNEHAKLQQVPLDWHQSFHTPLARVAFPQRRPGELNRTLPFISDHHIPSPGTLWKASGKARNRPVLHCSGSAPLSWEWLPKSGQETCQPHPCLSTLLLHPHFFTTPTAIHHCWVIFLKTTQTGMNAFWKPDAPSERLRSESDLYFLQFITF